MTASGDRRRGQATVELALALPFIALLLLATVQVLLVVRAQVLVTHAAREAARVAAVDGSPGAALAAAVDATDLDPGRLRVDTGERGPPGGRVTVTVRYRLVTDVPVVGRLLADLDLAATATMRVETGDWQTTRDPPWAQRRRRLPVVGAGRVDH